MAAQRSRHQVAPAPGRSSQAEPSVNPYFLLPLVSALVCVVCGVALLLRGPEATPNRCAAALMVGGGYWGICEALWTLAPDPVAAERVLRLSAPGWIAVGPTCMHLFLSQERGSWRGLRRLLPLAYGVAGAFLALVWIEPWLAARWFTVEMAPVPWGYAYRAGVLYPYWYAFTVATSSTGIFAVFWDMRIDGSPAESRQRPWLGTSVGIPLLVGSTTDGLLPAIGVELPRLGVPSFAVFGVLIAWSMHRFGFSVLAPSSFASQILESLPEGVALATPEGHIRVANPALASLLGTTIEELRGRPVQSFLPEIEPSAELELSERECELASERGLVPVGLSAAPLRDKRGALLGLVLVVRDLREVVSLRTRLLTSARLAAVGELAAGIAHEINNPLAYIGANLRALREQWTVLADAWQGDADKEEAGRLLDDGNAMLEDSLEGVERAAAIVRDVRAFSHGGGDASERFDANELLERALRVAAPHLRHRIRVVRQLGEVGLVEGARREIEQVFLNLIVNAAQAIQGAGTLRVRTRLAEGALEVSIADDGPGIEPEHLGRIFDPFFTTKPVGEGTGLGLSISHEIVRRHGGRIDVASSPGQGTEFRIRLPLAER
jgi:two-component system NtrC family sensor kinase